MKNRLYIIVITFIIYLGTYIFYGKSNLGLQIIENTTFKKRDSIQIQIFDLEDYHRNQLKIVENLKEKGFKTVEVNYAENFITNDKLIYWLDLNPLTPFISFSYDGHFKKNEIAEEFESIYVWCFFKWVRVYKSENRTIF